MLRQRFGESYQAFRSRVGRTIARKECGRREPSEERMIETIKKTVPMPEAECPHLLVAAKDEFKRLRFLSGASE